MLKDLDCKNALPREKNYRLFDEGGLYLEVTPAGGKHWKLKYRFDAKEKKLTFGPYPLISLAEARTKRGDAKRQLIDGIDPSAVKKEMRRQAELDRFNNFQKIAKEWLEHNNQAWSENHRNTVKRRLELDILPIIGNLPIKSIKIQMLAEMVRGIEKRGAHEVARRALSYCSQIFRFAIVRGLVEDNPVSKIKPRDILKSVERGHYAAIDYHQLPELISKLDRNEARLFKQTQLAIELMMLTFVRTGELIKAKWDEISFEDKKWYIGGKRMKMKKDHIVPLSNRAIDILNELRNIGYQGEYIFPSLREPRRHMSNNTILVALRRMGYAGIMTGHGFRSLAMSTIKEVLNYRHEVVDRQLAHAHKNEIDAAYDRALFLREREVMMQEWSDLIIYMRNNHTHAGFNRQLA